MVTCNFVKYSSLIDSCIWIWNKSFQALLAFKVSVEKSIIPMNLSFCVTCHFSFGACHVLSWTIIMTWETWLIFPGVLMPPVSGWPFLISVLKICYNFIEMFSMSLVWRSPPLSLVNRFGLFIVSYWSWILCLYLLILLFSKCFNISICDQVLTFCFPFYPLYWCSSVLHIFKIHLFILYVWMQECHSAHMDIRGWHSGVGSLLSLCGIDWNQIYWNQVCLQVSVYAESLEWPDWMNFSFPVWLDSPLHYFFF